MKQTLTLLAALLLAPLTALHAEPSPDFRIVIASDNFSRTLGARLGAGISDGILAGSFLHLHLGELDEVVGGRLQQRAWPEQPRRQHPARCCGERSA